MAVIEQEPDVPVKPVEDATCSGGAADGVEAEDGFETASEGDVREEKSDNEGDEATKKDEERQQSEVETCDSEAAEVVKAAEVEKQEEDDDDDEEEKQKNLEHANDAKVDGNKLFVQGQFEEALLKYELALQIVPEMPSSVELRSICHYNRSTCFSKMGKYEETIKECRKALELNANYMKALIRRAEAHEKLENFEEAIADLTKIIELDPSNKQARITKRRLEPLAAEKREKMKEEMIGKLKEMGNSLLGRFGMSVDNFKTVQDPNTGAYSIQFQR